MDFRILLEELKLHESALLSPKNKIIVKESYLVLKNNEQLLKNSNVINHNQIIIKKYFCLLGFLILVFGPSSFHTVIT